MYIPVGVGGAVQSICTEPSRGVAVRSNGGCGAPTTIVELAADAALVPAEFLAVTVKEYDCPFVSPFSVHEGGGTPSNEVHVKDFGEGPVVETV
jgi:hypothetical protein